MKKIYDKCPNCMHTHDGTQATCSYCGMNVSAYDSPPQALEPFTVLQNKYMLGRVLGFDDFGITYMGWDINLATYVSIKEYFPSTMAYRDAENNPGYTQVYVAPENQEKYQRGLEIYVEETRNLTAFYDMQGKIAIKDLFYLNGTAYKVEELKPEFYPTQIVNNAPGKNTAQKSNKTPIIISVVIVAAVLVGLLLYFTVFKDKDNSDTTETTTTEETTEETTELTTEKETTESTTTEEEVVVLPGTWSDFKFMINDTLYELPMTYEEWISYGWNTDVTDINYAAGEVRGLVFYNDEMECTAVLANYSSTTTTKEGCYVIGFQFSRDDYEVYQNGKIILPGDITIGLKGSASSDNISIVEDVYGEADESMPGEYISYYTYWDENGSYIMLLGDQHSAIYRVVYTTYKTPEGAEISSNAQAPEVLPVNVDYQTPSGTTDRFDDIFTIDGVNYKLPVPVSEFVKNGWTIQCDVTELGPNQSVDAVLSKGENTIDVNLSNYTVYKTEIEKCSVLEISIKQENCQGIDVVFPGGVKFGTDSTGVNTLYGQIDDESLSEYYEYETSGRLKQLLNYAVYDGEITVEVYSEPSETEEGVYYVSEYKYSHGRSSMDSNAYNVDYIEGIILE